MLRREILSLSRRLRYIDVSHSIVSSRKLLDSNRMGSDNDIRYMNFSIWDRENKCPKSRSLGMTVTYTICLRLPTF